LQSRMKASPMLRSVTWFSANSCASLVAIKEPFLTPGRR
jgi:hypothetical protein